MDVVFFEPIGQTMQDLGRRSVSLFSSRHVERNRKPPSNAWSGLQPLEPRILLSGAESIGDEIVQWSHDEILIANGAEQEDAPDLVGFAQALTDAGVKFFGAAWCSHCTTQKETFEDGAGFLNFIEVTNPDRSPNQVALDEDVWGFPLWKFPDGTQVSGTQSLAALTQHSGVGIPNSNEPFIAPIDDMQLLTDSPLHVAVDGYDPNHDNLAYEVSVRQISGDAVVNAHVLEGNRSARIVVQGFGTITVQLFEGRAGRAAKNFIELALRDFYNDKIVHRTVKDFVIQLGGVTTEYPGSYDGLAQMPSPLGTYRDQFHRQLQHNQPGLLSAAKAVDDGNSTDVFITAAAARGLDYQHSVFGIVVEGDDNRDAINNTATLPVQNPLAPQGEQSLPAIPVVIDRVEIFEDHENAVAMLEVEEGTFGEFEVTIEATDGHGHRFERAFKVTVAQDVVNSNPFVDDIGPVATANNAVTFDIPAVDVEGDAPTFFANKVGHVDYDLTVDASTGEVTLTPPTGFLGTVTVEVGVEQPTALDPFDREVVEILFEGDAPSATDDAYNVIEYGTLILSAETGVLRNDGDVDGDDLTAILVDDVSNGELTLNADGSFTYAPDGDFNGLDSFTYKANDGTTDSDLVTVTVDVVSGVSIGSARGKEKVLFNVGHVDVTVKIAGDGQAEVFDVGNGLYDIELTRSWVSTTVTVTTKNGFFDLRNFSSDGPMKAFVAKTTNLHGDIEIAGSIKSIVMNNVEEQQKIEIGTTAGLTVPVSLAFKEISDLSIMSLSPIKSLAATRWLDTDGDRDFVMAPSLQKLIIKGDKKKHITGKFQADLDLDGTDGSSLTLSSAKIADGVDDVNWGLIGDVGTIDIKGNVTNMDVIFMSNLRTFKSGSATNLIIEVDNNISKVEVASWDGGALVGSTTKSIAVKGNKKTGVPGTFDDVRVTLMGAWWTNVTQTLAKLQVTGDSDGATIDIWEGDTGAVDFKGSVDNLYLWAEEGQVKSIKLGRVTNASVYIHGSAGAVSAKEWLAGTIRAHYIKSLKTTGDKNTDIAGDYKADLDLSGVGVLPKKNTLGTAAIAGNIAGIWDIDGDSGNIKALATESSWELDVDGYVSSIYTTNTIGGAISASWFGKIYTKGHLTADITASGQNTAGVSIAKLTVTGTANHSTVRASGSIFTISLGATDGSDFLAGITERAGRHATDYSDFVNDLAIIKSIAIKGFKIPVASISPRYVLDSNFSSASIGSVTLLNGGFDNEGIDFGIFVRNIGTGVGITGKEIISAKYTDKSTAETWYWKSKSGDDTGEQFRDGDFVIEIIGVSNTPPVIMSMAAIPNPVTQGDSLTLSANDVSDSDGAVVKVEFYLDSNSSSALEVATDQLLGTDMNSTGGWTWTDSTVSLSLGTNRYFARAQDNDLEWSNTATTTGRMISGVTAPATLSGKILHLNAETFTASGWEIPFSGATVSFYFEPTGNGYVRLGGGVSQDSTGTYVYVPTDHGAATLVISDNVTEMFKFDLEFSTESEAVFVLNDPDSSGNQTGTVIVTESSENYAPDSIRNSSFYFEVFDGGGSMSGPEPISIYFAKTWGTYLECNGNPEVFQSVGVDSYRKIGPSTAEINIESEIYLHHERLVEGILSADVHFIYTSPTSGVYFARGLNGNDFQRGTFSSGPMPSDLAPVSLLATLIHAEDHWGTWGDPFVVSGDDPSAGPSEFDIVTDETTQTYELIGDETIADSSGIYIYERVSGDTATILVNDALRGSGRFDLAFESPLLAKFEFSSDIFETPITGRMSVVDKYAQNLAQSGNRIYCLLNADPN